MFVTRRGGLMGNRRPFCVLIQSIRQHRPCAQCFSNNKSHRKKIVNGCCNTPQRHCFPANPESHFQLRTASKYQTTRCPEVRDVIYDRAEKHDVVRNLNVSLLRILDGNLLKVLAFLGGEERSEREKDRKME